MSFFLPSRLVDLEYLSDDEVDDQYEKIAEPYLEDIDFAFFVVNFGYTKKDYESLTKREKAFIYKAWENKVVSDSYNTYNACFTAFYNANRKKNKRALKLWKKKRQIGKLFIRILLLLKKLTEKKVKHGLILFMKGMV